jgi:sugar/nucleoside kinase (ribokinase family)
LDFIFSGLSALPASGEETMAGSFAIQLGGGTLAYPIILSRLGVPCHVLVRRSRNVQADLAASLLDASGIAAVEYVDTPEFDAVMSTAVMSLPADRCFVSHQDSRSFQFDHDLILDRQLGSPVVFAQPEHDALLPRLRAAGSKVVFDLGWSDDLSLEPYRRILAQVDYFTPNDKEAAKLTGAVSPDDSLVILEQHVPHPIISCGASGCLARIDGAICQIVPPPGIRSIDTTGAGDNFMSGLIFGLYNNLPLLDCLKIAVVAGSLSTTAPGCYGCAYTLDQVMNQVPAVTVQNRQRP